MAQEKGVGNTSVLILKLLEEKDMLSLIHI